MFSKLYGVLLNRIERYIRHWGRVPDPDDPDIIHHKLTGKAYPTDEYEYGQCRQMFDFYKALIGEVPNA
jgi:hypothetical protein